MRCFNVFVLWNDDWRFLGKYTRAEYDAIVADHPDRLIEAIAW